MGWEGSGFRIPAVYFECTAKKKTSISGLIAVLESTDGNQLRAPVFFHLHDSYKPNKIRISKMRYDGMQAILGKIDSEGTFTLGVQFKDSNGAWRSLEYDLCFYDKGSLKKYD